MSRASLKRVSMRAILTGAMQALVLLGLACGESSVAGQIDQVVRVNIPKGTPFDSALIRLAQEITDQTGMHVMVASKSIGREPTQGLSGTLPASLALSTLLRGSGLTYEAADDTVAIKPASASGVADSRAFRGPQNAPSDDEKAPAASSAQEAAQPQTEGPGGFVALEEVVVTAQKYRELAFDVPISMSVIGGSQLQRLGITDLEGLQYEVPGMLVEHGGPTMVITIRGISNVFGQGALVGTYLDEADVTSEGSFGLDLNAYDLSRVEVLKGPQGTLYGEGSLGGTIRYITNKPALDGFEFGTNVTGLFDEYGAPESRIEAVVNAPVVPNVLGLRIAADLDEGGGWVDQPAADQKNINSKNLADARIEGRWEPAADLTVDAMEVIHREKTGPFTGENPIGIYTQVFSLATTPSIEDNYNVSNVTVHWDPGPISVVDSATYFTHSTATLDFGQTLQETPPPSPRFDEYYSETTTDESLSDELRVSSSASERWRWTVGGLYKRLDDNTPYLSAYFGLPGPPGSPLPAPFPYYADVNSNAASVFGDTNYRLFGALLVGAGVRYFRDEENALLFGDTGREKATFTSADPRFYVRYPVSTNVNLYASAAKGFRSGGFNGLGLPQFDPEHVWTYDLGMKTRLFGGEMGLNSDVFFSNYGGYQIVGVAPPPNPPYNITHNAGDARVKGVESEVVWMPSDRWRLSINGDYIDARFVAINVLDSSYQVGDPLDLVPRYQITASTEREFRWNGRSGFARLDYTQRSREIFRNRAIGPWYYSQSDELYLLDFRTGIDWTTSLRFEFFVQNLLNDRGYTGSDAIETYAAREQPRTFGVEFDLKAE